jgi:hypothetical protein
MVKAAGVFSSVFVLLLLSIGIVTSCCAPDTGVGKVSGVVTDDERYLPQGTKAQTYEGASISIYKAVEAGTYKLSEGAPVTKNFELGDPVKQVVSGKGGAWEAELPAGKYFIRAFVGKQSHSGDILVEVIKGSTVKLDIKLISGV